MRTTTIQPVALGQVVAGVRAAIDDHTVHIYGTDVTRVGSSVRRYYDHPAER